MWVWPWAESDGRVNPPRGGDMWVWPWAESDGRVNPPRGGDMWVWPWAESDGRVNPPRGGDMWVWPWAESSGQGGEEEGGEREGGVTMLGSGVRVRSGEELRVLGVSVSGRERGLTGFPSGLGTGRGSIAID